MTLRGNGRSRSSDMELPPAVYLDACFIADAFFSHTRLHHRASDLMRALRTRATVGRVRIVTSTRALDEVLWIARSLLYERDHGPGAWSDLSPPERNDAWIRYSEEIANLGRILLSPHAPWEVLSVTAADLGVAVGAMESHSLQPADASHYAVALRACEGHVVTNDRHFRGLAELNVIRYDDGD